MVASVAASPPMSAASATLVSGGIDVTPDEEHPHPTTTAQRTYAHRIDMHHLDESGAETPLCWHQPQAPVWLRSLACERPPRNAEQLTP